MKKIKIKKILLENFKCHKNLAVEFSENTTVYGNNATGKSSIYDALTWLLFGRDSRGNGEKNMEIKPLRKDGEVRDHDAITSIEAIFDLDGAEISLKRTYREVWSTKRGSLEPTYDGNTSDYFCDGIPLTRTAFRQRVDELVSEEVFRLLTSVSYFAEDMPWQERRAVLFKASGTMDDKSIMATNEEFTPLIDATGGHTLEEYKKKLVSIKKSISSDRDEIPARISECEKTVSELATVDFDGIRARVDELSRERDRLSAQVLAIDNDTASSKKNVELGQARLKLDELEAENRRYREAQEVSGSASIPALEVKLRSAKARYAQLIDQIKSAEARLADTKASIEDCRQSWMETNAETFDAGKKSCPTCGQALPADQLRAVIGAFEDSKKQRLAYIEKRADERKQDAARMEEQIGLMKADGEALHEEISCLEAEIATYEAKQAAIVIEDMEGYADTKEGMLTYIHSLESELLSLREDAAAKSREYRIKLSRCTEELNGALKDAAKEDVLTYSEKRIEELRNEAAATAEKLAEIERQLWLCEKFTRYKATFIEDSVNGLFRIARFRLFREQANGGIEDRCDVMYDGVPYNSVNTGMRINLGIDIINTLSRVYGVSVPLFIDNAECVTKIEGYDGQLIRLVVSENDKELRIENEIRN